MAETNNFNGVIDSLMKGMNTVLATKTVVGEATKVGDTIILPLVDVSFGVGAGANSAERKNGAGGGFAEPQCCPCDPERFDQARECQESGCSHQDP